jgi:hypothetical protein
VITIDRRGMRLLSSSTRTTVVELCSSNGQRHSLSKWREDATVRQTRRERTRQVPPLLETTNGLKGKS